MDTPRTSEAPIRPQGPRNLLFQGADYRYEYVRPLIDNMVLARRTALRGGEPPSDVLLRRVVLPPKLERRQRALEEVQLAAHLHHPHIAQVYGLEQYDGRPYVVTEFLPGCFLDTAIGTALERRHKLSPSLACYIAVALADALHYAWHCTDKKGQPLHVVHRAVSPMTIRLGLEGQVKLTDFGVAWSELTGRTPTAPHVLRADVAYGAPELMRLQPPDGRADLYSLGMVLLEMLAGHYPLDPPDVAQLPPEDPAVARYNARVRPERLAWTSAGELANRIQRFGPEDVERAAPHVPGQLKRIVHKMLRSDPADRYQTGAELRADLLSYLQQAKPFGAPEAAAELAALVFKKKSPDETHVFPAEKGVVPTPEEDAMAWKNKPQH
ncbi:serine/threonine-protein kinase [Archangium sp.]|uniref:serine/threonine-protein kinase n=1 Tax=Archangium sp. TaxID=1872627 RepID=UPI00389AFB39